MGEFASNAKANAGLTTGIIGTTLGGLWALGAGNGGNGGVLGGLFGGGNNNLVAGLMAENKMQFDHMLAYLQILNLRIEDVE